MMQMKKRRHRERSNEVKSQGWSGQGQDCAGSLIECGCVTALIPDASVSAGGGTGTILVRVK